MKSSISQIKKLNWKSCELTKSGRRQNNIDGRSRISGIEDKINELQHSENDRQKK
jgi:hypothetical protein